MTDDVSEIRDALRKLLSDIEAMYEGAELSDEGRQSEEFFGPFLVWKPDDSDYELRVSISWPNLAISLRNAKNALHNADVENA